MIRYPGFFFLLAALSTTVIGADTAPQWEVDSEQSRLGFTATFEGAEFEGEFPLVEAIFRFDPERLSESRFEVRVDITGTDTGSPDLNDGMMLPEWFDSERFPSAAFVSSAIEHDADNRYIATGTLTVKGVSRTVVLPFTWENLGDSAVINGRTTLNRIDFRIGEGDWSNADVIGLNVAIWTQLNLNRTVP